MISRANTLSGVLWGTAVGDSLGLPAEGLSRKKIKSLGWKDNWKHRFIFKRGMLSDDTEHTITLAQAMLTHSDDVDAFQKLFAAKLRWWFAALPAGIGLATARAIIKLWLGVSPKKSGVYSAGNGPAMRSAIIGAFYAEEPDKLEAYVRASTLVTHTDPKALVGALAIAYCAATPTDQEFVLKRLESLTKLETDEWPKLLQTIKQGVNQEWSMLEFTSELGIDKGVSGYVYHTVPVALFAWLRWPDQSFEKILVEVHNCGGDTDTTGAIVGAIAGARFGEKAIPLEWKEGVSDWPISRKQIDRYAACLNNQTIAPSPEWFLSLIRNMAFLLIVTSHGLLRLLPAKIRR